MIFMSFGAHGYRITVSNENSECFFNYILVCVNKINNQIKGIWVI